MSYLIKEVSPTTPRQTELMPLPRNLASRVMEGDNAYRIRVAVLKEMMPKLRQCGDDYLRAEFLD